MTTLFGVSWWVWGCLCLLIAAIYIVIWPRPKSSMASVRPRWQHWILRWFHSLVWVLLAVSCFIRPNPSLGGSTLANILALLALGVYGIFISTLLLERATRR